MSQRVVSWWKYNPILQKPASLDAVKPWCWYWYYGPDPVSGLSYGQYHDEDHDFDMLSQKKKVVYSPATGKPMKLIADISEDEVDEMFSQAKGAMSSEPKMCTACEATIVSDFDLDTLDKYYCYSCGKECMGCENKGGTQEADAKLLTEKQTMKKEAKADRVRNLKRKIRANLLKKRKTEAKKTEEKTEKKEEKKKPVVDRETLRKKAAMASRLRARDLERKRRIRAEEEAKKEKEEEEDDDDLISLDKIMESMEEECKDEECEEEEVAEAAEETEEEPAGEKEDEDELISLDEVMEAMHEVEAEDEEMELEDSEEEPVEEPVEDEEDFEVEEPVVEDEDFEVEEPVDFEEEEKSAGGEDKDEYYDLDMVLSMINKREKLSKKRKARAEEGKDKEVEKDKAELEKGEKKEEKGEKKEGEKAADPTGEKPEGDKEKPEGESETEPNMAVEESPLPTMPVEMDAMRFEPLASVAALASVTKEQIDMTLYNEESENPVWNVTVAGVPTARIQLKNQMHPEEIRSVFCSDEYAKDLMIHCEKSGFVPTMNKVKAEYWSNYTSNKKLAERLTKEAKASLTGERKKLLATFKQDFRTCINIVSAGMAKNFYPDMGNPLKEHLFANLRSVGLPEQTAISVVEKSFTEGAAPYFNSLFEKSEEYMGLSQDARKEIAAAISHGSSLAVEEGGEIADAEVSLSDRLARASAVASITSPNLKVNTDLVMDTNEYKAQLKSLFRK